MHQLSKDPDFIVYSSHKTGTQTLVRSLSAAGHRAIHLHGVGHLDGTIGQFREYLKYYREKYGKKVKIISAFRLPIERHISSFFQWYGDGAWIQRFSDYTSEDTVIHQIDIKGLNSLLVSDIASRKLAGYRDSLHELCKILEIDSMALREERYQGSYRVDHELAEITLARFSDLFKDSLKNIFALSGASVQNICEANISGKKWYSTKYEKFKAGVFIPENVIQQTYLDRKDLIEVFYPGLFDELLEADCRTYCHLRSHS
jgi:hypothetical protein